VKRRHFITLLGGAAVWPLVARAQQSVRVRRIGVLLNLAEDDQETRKRVAAFLDGLQKLGWSEGRNLRIEYRWGEGNRNANRKNAAEIVALAPDVIFAHGSSIVAPLLQLTQNIPIVFVSVSDPIAGGFVESLAKPGGNATGFTSIDYSMAGKWLELLKQLTPEVVRVAVIRDPRQVSGAGQLGAVQAVAPLLRVELIPLGVQNAAEIEQGISAFAREPHGGLIVTTSALAQVQRQLIVTLAAQHRLPAVYPYRLFTASGGLVSYGPDIVDEYRRAAGYVDRILKGEKAASLPVQQPVKYDTIINLKTARALGLTIPEQLLARADEVIE
jgi:putative tryptophan/tyrosine transport system substrate-binding protein